jgi:hypothetical protein
MIPADTSEWRRIFGRLDPTSQWTLWRFLLKLGTIVIFAVGIIQRPVANSILVLAYVNLMLCLAVAILRREPCASGPLNHWDEAVTFAGLCAVAHAVGLAAG